MSAIARLRHQRNNPPKPAPASTNFAGRTILVTGASGGLGLEAAKKLALFSTSKLVITARSVSKGEAAKREIEDFVRQHSPEDVGKTEIVVMELSMDSFAAVVKFAGELRSRFSQIDAAILNAGTLQAAYAQSPDGWEQTMQVNTLSTFLLGLLILPLLIKAAEVGDAGYKPHLTFVSSGLAFTVTQDHLRSVVDKELPLAELSKASSFPSGMIPGQAAYSRSKFLLECITRRLAAMPALKDAKGETKVVVNSVCPGMCKSDLGRNVQTNMVADLGSWVINSFFARTTEQGANAYITALLQPNHGETWKDDQSANPGPMFSTEAGQKFGEKVWREACKVMVTADGTTKVLLGSKL